MVSIAVGVVQGGGGGGVDDDDAESLSKGGLGLLCQLAAAGLSGVDRSEEGRSFLMR